MKPQVLLVEDEPGIQMILADRLDLEGYEVDTAEDGDTGLHKALNGKYDLVILDVMLPKKSGFEVCRTMRQNNIMTPVLMLTARGNVVDKVTGLQIGADDYLTKPFDTMELVARLQALLRRSQIPGARLSDTYEFADVKVDFKRSEVTRAGAVVPMSAREFQLLRYLIEHRDETISREELLKEVWGYEATPETRTVDVHMAWLRQKLEENQKFPKHFVTVRGMGYRFSEA
ncbi:MAG: response regulator transcription factor [Acidobacteria bacterium]|nr:response regulator transcription factor [Acidobacteriota bacterium]